MLRRTASGIAPRTTTSDTAKRPPGLSTRNASPSTRRLSAERLITQFEMTTSTEASGSGMFSISPFKNSTFATPDLRWFSRASASISSVMSRPYAFPVEPTRLAESSTSIPPPEPRSSTISPACSSARAVGLPQPSEASTAPSGSAAVSPASYRFELTGSQPQLPPCPSSTRVAAWPYFAFTVSLISSPLMGPTSRRLPSMRLARLHHLAVLLHPGVHRVGPCSQLGALRVGEDRASLYPRRERQPMRLPHGRVRRLEVRLHGAGVWRGSVRRLLELVQVSLRLARGGVLTRLRRGAQRREPADLIGSESQCVLPGEEVLGRVQHDLHHRRHHLLHGH